MPSVLTRRGSWNGREIRAPSQMVQERVKVKEGERGICQHPHSPFPDLLMMAAESTT